MKEADMKICLLTRYFDFRNAGLGRVSLEIYKELVRRGYEVKAVSTNGTSLYSYFFYTLLEIPLRIPRNCDVYHALTPMESIWIPKEKSVVTFHDLFQITDRDKLGSGLGYSGWKNFIGCNYFKFAVNVAKRCKRIVAVSEKTKEDLISELGIDRGEIKVIKSGIRDDLEPQPRKDEKFRIGYLGQLDRRKRLNLLINAFKRSELDELVIGGIGPDKKILEEQAQGDKRIKFLGLVPDDKLSEFYNSLDLFVFPTWVEGYGLPIVEAMACKKPVMVLVNSKIPFEVKDRCIWVQDLVPVLSTSHLLRLCKSVNIEDNYKWAKKHSWKVCVDEYIKLYEEVTG